MLTIIITSLLSLGSLLIGSWLGARFSLRNTLKALEIQDAQKKWEFALEIYPSLTDSTGRILKVKHLKKVISND